MGNFIDYNTSITKGAAEQASNAELAAKYKSMMADQAVGKHVEAAAMQAHDVGAAKGYEAGTRDGGLHTLAAFIEKDVRSNPNSYINGVNKQIADAQLLQETANNYYPIRTGPDDDVAASIADREGLAGELARLNSYKAKLQHGMTNQPKGMEVMYMNTKAPSDVKYDMDMDKYKYDHERALHQ